MISIAEARRFVLDNTRVRAPETVPLGEALGHVLAETIVAPHDVPSFDNSAMDGFAVLAADCAEVPVRLRVVATVMAGDEPSVALRHGEAIRIMTGAPMPPGADAVCVVERTRSEDGGSVVVIEDRVAFDANVRHAGEDVRTGMTVLDPQTLLGPAHLGLLASLGFDAVVAVPLPSVGVISTGDELIGTGSSLRRGKIRDSNRPALLGQLRADGFDPIDLGVVGDDESALIEAFERAAHLDAIVTSGGVSFGEHDFVHTALEKLCGETVRAMQIALKPGRPFSFGVLSHTGSLVFGVPGNPVAALVSYELLVRPALRKMAGNTELDRPLLSAVADEDFRRRADGKIHLARVICSSGADGRLRVRSAGGQDSHQLRAMATANALALLPDGDGVRAGETVSVLLLDVERLRAEHAPYPW